MRQRPSCRLPEPFPRTILPLSGGSPATDVVYSRRVRSRVGTAGDGARTRDIQLGRNVLKAEFRSAPSRPWSVLLQFVTARYSLPAPRVDGSTKRTDHSTSSVEGMCSHMSSESPGGVAGARYVVFLRRGHSRARPRHDIAPNEPIVPAMPSPLISPRVVVSPLQRTSSPMVVVIHGACRRSVRGA